jgi:hypothetical protein
LYIYCHAYPAFLKSSAEAEKNIFKILKPEKLGHPPVAQKMPLKINEKFGYCAAVNNCWTAVRMTELALRSSALAISRTALRSFAGISNAINFLLRSLFSRYVIDPPGMLYPLISTGGWGMILIIFINY